MDIDIISGLYHYGLTIIKYEQDYCLVDLKTQEVYEKAVGIFVDYPFFQNDHSAWIE